MLYNKNNVRKTNDKKILHKVGKQWKVVSVALLMALGGGAAVAATNTANANADANNGVSQETQATVNSLEQGPQIGQSSAPASASSKASSASSAAPVMPQLSLNPDPSLNGNNASAELARVTQGYDNAVVKFYGNKVQSYVNFVNSNYSASANSVKSNYASASNKQSNDSSSASSFAAVASGKDWMNEVNNIASAKSGVTGSEFIDAVQNSTSTNSVAVSSANDVASNANSVVSAARLVSNIIFNSDVRDNYGVKAESARFASQSAAMVFNYESNAYSLANKNSLANQTSYNNNFISSEVLSLADSAALQNASGDINTTSSLAKANNNMSYASASSEVSAEAVANKTALLDQVFNAAIHPGTHNYPHVSPVVANLNNAARNAKGILSNQNLFNKLNPDQKATVNDVVAINNAVNKYRNPKAVNTEINKIQNIPQATAKKVVDTVANDLHLSNNYATALENKVANKGININKNINPKDIKFNPKDGSVTIGNLPTFTKKYIDTELSNAMSSATNAFKGVEQAVAPTNKRTKQASTTVKAPKPLRVANYFNLNDPATYQLVLDTAVQQNYGSLKSSCDNAINSAKVASASDAATVTSASAAMTSASAKNASASSEYQSALALATANSLGDVENIVKPSKNDFYSFYVNNNNRIVSVRKALNLPKNANSSAVSSAVSTVASLANDAGSAYTSASNASENYAKSTDANFVLANVYANSYEAMSSSDNSAFNSASAAQVNFYNTYAGSDFASDNDQLTSAKADEPNQGALANGYARYVQIHEPHVVTVTKQLVMHANPNYNDKTDTPADAKLAVINKGTHLLVENVGFDKHGNTRLYVNYNGKKGFITGLRNYVADSYLVPGEKYSVTFGRTANQYKGLQFNKANATKFSVKAGQTVTGTAVLNDDPHYWNGLTRLQLSNGNFVTTLDSYIKSATPLNGQSTQQSKGAYFWNGQDNTFKNVTK